MFNNPRNIAEFVLKRVIEENKYRDDEIKKLQDVLEEFNIVKCIECNEYTNNIEICDMCDYKGCFQCSQIKHYDTYNLSGMALCKKCSGIYCNWCLTKKEANKNCPRCYEDMIL